MAGRREPNSRQKNGEQTSARVRSEYASPSSLIDVDALLPPDLGKFPVSRAMARWLASVVHALRCRSVLEFGAGWSSLVIAEALAAEGGGRLTSVDHAPQHISLDAWRRVQQARHVDSALIVLPLRRTLSTNGWLWSYKGLRRRLGTRVPFDLVFIDAPPGRYGRTSPLFDVYSLLHPGAVIVLDDAARPGEQRAIARWLATLPDLELVLLDTQAGRGIAVLVRHGGGRPRPALGAVLGTFRDRLMEWRKGRNSNQ